MFKNIQNKIIFTHPLIWNIKLIPMLIVLGIFHLIIFTIGYFHGTIDLEYSFLIYEYQEFTFISITSLVLFLLFIFWIYYYMRNNAFEYFYPKKAFDIYKEWLITLLIIFLIIGFPITYFFGKESKIRTYITEETLKKEIETIKKASLFINGNYIYEDFKFIKDYESYEEIPDSLVDQNSIKVSRDSIIFNQKIYPYYSYFNKSLDGYIHLSEREKKDSILETQVKLSLQNNEKLVIKNIFDDYLKIQSKYQHKNNLTTQKWLDLCYHFPNFEEKIFIGKIYDNKILNEPYNDEVSETETNVVAGGYNLYDTTKYDYIFKNSVRYYTNNNQVYYKYKFYTDYEKTNKLLNIFSDAYNNRECNLILFLILLYTAGSLSFILFIYKMFQWKNWLLTIISSLIISVILGILSVIIDHFFFRQYEELLITGMCLVVFLLIIIWFIYSIYNFKSKKKSGILLGLTIVILPIFLIILSVFLEESIKELSGYNYIQQTSSIVIDLENQYPWVYFFQKLKDMIFFINPLFVIIIMYPMSIFIKKWKSLPEA